MKRYLTMLIILFTIVSLSRAKEKNIIAVNLLGFAIDMQNFEYESAVGDKTGIALYFARSGYANSEVDSIQKNIAEQKITIRHYIGEECLKGAWFGFSVGYISGDVWNVKTPSADYINNLSMLIPGVEAGYRFMMKKFNAALFITTRYAVADNLIGTKESKGTVEDLKPSAGMGITIGWHW
ncbi:MAG: DUF3575 domain-containing protein [Elusimicrobiota bacterium]